MRVLAITPTFLPDVGGLETVVYELSRRAALLGVKMDVAHVSPDFSKMKRDCVNGVDVYRVPLIGNRLIGWAPAMASLLGSYDLLHVHDPQLLAITANVRLYRNGAPSVLSTHGGFWHTRKFRRIKSLYERTLLRSMLSCYDAVLATSVGDYDYFSRFSDHIDLCVNGVDVKKFNSVPDRHARSVFRWIYWGRLSRNKRLDLAIDYVAHARDLGYPVDLLICGKDFDHILPDLMAQVSRLGLEDAITFVSYLNDVDLLAEIESRGTYISATEHEGFGLGIVEAMAAGLIVVCRDMSPLNNFISNRRSGWFLQFDGSTEDLLLLKELLSLGPKSTLHVSRTARQSASVYDWDNAASKFIEKYSGLLKSP